MYQTSKHQREVDTIFAAHRENQAQQRRPLFKPPPPPPARSTSTIDLRVAEELQFVRRRLDLLGDMLASDPILLHRHSTALQEIDQIGQTLGHLATIAEAEDKEAAAGRISLGELKARLLRRALEL